MKTSRLSFSNILIMGLLMFLFLNGYDCYSQTDIIVKRIKNDLLARDLNDSLITNYINTLNPDGSWSDIDYSNTSNTNWVPINHSRRLLSICQAYNKTSSIHYHNPGVKASIINIINFYLEAKPNSSNWWWNAIGAPTNFGPALVLMKSDDGFGIDQPLLEKYTDLLLNYYSDSAVKWPSATTGANKIWLLSSSIDKACIKNNEEVLRSNFFSAFEEAEIMTGKTEGIKIDHSFYQHGTQLYCGGYGMSFMSDITYFATLASGTAYQMSDDKMKVITDVILDGYQWLIYRSVFDFGAIGREISRPNAGSSLALRTYMDRLISVKAPRIPEMTQFITFINGKAPFQTPGNRYFWKSDIMVQHGPDFYLSAKVPSKRIIGTERMNNENLKRKWLPWGATNIMTEGDEYRNIYPVWDWSRIPGVTSVMEEIQGLPVTGGSYIISTADFAGGVSDSVFGLAGYDYSWDGVSGRKAYFFTPEAMFCLGSGIKASKENQVITNVNQCFSSGIVTIKNKKKAIFDVSEMTYSDLKWIHHDNVGYCFPAGGKITVKNMDQTGSWNDINSSQSKAKVTHKIFSAWIDHGNSPSAGTYEYMVVPSKNADEFEKWILNNSYVVISNTPEIQAVSEKKSGVHGISFYKPGKLKLTADLLVETDKPCLLLIQSFNKEKQFRISISDPTATLQNIVITVSEDLDGEGVIHNSDGTSSIMFGLPAGDEAGKTVTRGFQIL